MTKIEPINLHSFSNNEHYWFMADFDQLVSSHPTSIWGMDVLYGVFQNTLMAEDLALRVEQGSSISQTLEHLDHLRGKTWNAISLMAKATLLSPFEEEVKSAQIIQRILLRYGDVCSMTYNEQSSAITNMTFELLQMVNEEVLNKIGLRDWIIELKSQNEQFHAVYSERNSDFAGRESGDVKAVRTLIDPVYGQLGEKINASIVLEFAQPEVKIFVSKLNEKIKYYSTTLIDSNNSNKVERKEKA